MRYRFFIVRFVNLVLILVLFGVYQGVSSYRAQEETIALLESTAAAANSAAAGQTGSAYMDGTYTGSAEGFGGTIDVQVTISGGRITTIDIVSATGEDASYLEMAKGIIDAMLAAQTSEVDTISGATFSSTGIKNAVAQALAQAGGDTPTTTDPSGMPGATGTTDPAGTTDPSATTDSAGATDTTGTTGTMTAADSYQDGTYTGSAEGFGGAIDVQVTISGGRITAIEVTSAPQEDASYLDMAKGIINSMIDAQSADVDTVSGATFSSTGIRDAVADALEQAVM